MSTPQISNGIEITEENRGPLIKIATWIMLVSLILTAIAKLSSKVIMVRKLQADDLLISAAVLLTIANVVAVCSEVDGGLGQYISALSPAQITKFEQSRYASQIFYVVALFVARLAVLWFLYFLARGSRRRNSIRYLVGINVLWSAATAFTVAFQCAPPKTWGYLSPTSKCINIGAFWDVFTIMEIVMDLASSLLPIFLIYDLQLPKGKKISILLAFFVRLFVIPLVILRLVYFMQSNGSADATYDEFNFTLVTEIHLMASVIAACVPFLKPVMDSLQTGLLTSDLRGLAPSRSHQDESDSRMPGGGTGNRYKYPLSSLVKSPGGTRKGNASSLSHSRWGAPNSNYTMEISGDIANVHHAMDMMEGGRDGDASIRSRDPMLINQTTTIVIETEEDDSPGRMVSDKV